MLEVVLEDRNHPVGRRQRERVEIARRVSRRMNTMLDDLIDITRLKERTVPLNLRPVRLQTVADRLMDMMSIMLEGKPVRLEVDIARDFPPVKADEYRLAQILFNLLHNAVKYTDDGLIRVRAQRQGHMAEIRVEDTGIGIAEEDLPNIFQPYEQSRHDARRGRGGFGLGLGICKQLVELHGGTIRAASRLGEGSVFVFTLPLADGEEPVHDEGPVAGQGGGGAARSAPTPALIPPEPEPQSPVGLVGRDISAAKLLIVDDDAVNLQVLVQTLSLDGYAITGVACPEQALELLGRERCDLVIADLMMPRMSGYELTRRIRSRFNTTELPVLLLTALTRTEDLVAGFQAGANDFVKKPADALELRTRVRSLVGLKLAFEDRLRMESAWLKSQIKPHFLYNTLNSIAAMGYTDFDKMQSLLHEFSRYLRLSFDFRNAAPLVELERTSSSSSAPICTSNWSASATGSGWNGTWRAASRSWCPRCRSSRSWRTRSSTASCAGTKAAPSPSPCRGRGITRRSRSGTTASAWSGGRIGQLLAEPAQPGTGMSVGLRNIDRRLKQLFQDGLRVESAPDQGTVVRFRVPL